MPSIHRHILLLSLMFSSYFGIGQTLDFLGFVPKNSTAGQPQPGCAAVNSQGYVYISYPSLKSVHVFDREGNPMEVIYSVVTTGGYVALKRPTLLCIDANDCVYIYDEDLGQIAVRPVSGESRVFGEKGSSLGQLSDITSIAADNDGFLYALNSSRKDVSIFSNKGVFQTWIAGGASPFIEPISIGINGKNELYVLDKDGPTVYMFNSQGLLVNVNRNLNRLADIDLADAGPMTVLQSGDFIVHDRLMQRSYQFNRLGDLVGSFGSKGKGAPGVFEQVLFISSHSVSDRYFYLYDGKSRQGQLLTLPVDTKNLMPEVRTWSVQPVRSVLPAARLLSSGPFGELYAVLQSDAKTVIAYADTSGKELYRLKENFGYVQDLAVDLKGNLYVLDKDERSVTVYDSKGRLIRKISPTDKMKRPRALVVQRNGTVIVAEENKASLHMWSDQGVLLRSIDQHENPGLNTLGDLQCDSKDQLYYWDRDANAIFRLGMNGWPVSKAMLTVRPSKPGGRAGIISAFYIDELDQLHVFNSTNSQLEVYRWKDSPQLLYTVGYAGKGENGWVDVETVQFDADRYLIHFLQKDQSELVYRFQVKPVSPSDGFIVDADEHGYKIVFTKADELSVFEYGIVKTTSQGDSLVSRGPDSIVHFPFTDEHSTDLTHYGLVHLSKTDVSVSNSGFSDYLTLGRNYLSVAQYDDALWAFNNATTKTTYGLGLVKKISEYLRQTGDQLQAKQESKKALQFYREAFTLEPKNTLNSASLKRGYYNYFLQFANKDEYIDLLREADLASMSSAQKPIVLLALDSVAVYLSGLPNESTINNALLLQKKCQGLDPQNPSVYYSVASITYSLYELRRNSGVNRDELDLLLSEVLSNCNYALGGFQKTNPKYFYVELLQLRVNLLMEEYESVETNCLSTLTGSSYILNPDLVKGYRHALAEAYAGQKKYELAVSEYQRLERLDPSDVAIKKPLAEALVKSKQYDEAKMVFQQLLMNDLSNMDYVAQIGIIELLKGNYVESSFQLEKAVKANPSDRRNYGPLAEAFEGSSNYQKALDNYSIAIDYLRERITQLENSVTANEVLLDYRKTYQSYLLKSARLCDQVGDLESSIARYGALVESDPTNASAFYGLGKAYLNAGYIYDAEKALFQASKLDPSTEAYGSALNSALRERESTVKAVALNIIDVQIPPIYPSLYRNYSDVKLLPLGEVVIANNSDQAVTPSSITVFIPELMNQPSQVKAPTLLSYSNTPVKLTALFTEKILQSVREEKYQVQVEITYTSYGKKQSASKTSDVTLMGRNAITWKDKRRLAAFVAPNDDVLISYNKKGDIVFRNQSHYGLNRALIEAMQTYTLIQQSGFVYSPDPVQNFATVSTKTDILDYLQYPSETLKRKSGDCDDLVALFCGLLENAGVSTAYVDVPGHVFMAFDTQIRPSEIGVAGFNALDVIVSDNKVWLPIETTVVGTGDFMTAWKKGAERYYQELKAARFPEIVPLSSARSIYIPSSYTPAGFSEEPPQTEAVLESYATLLKLALAKTKKELIAEMQTRYMVEVNNLYVKNKYATLLAQIGENKKAEEVFLEAYALSPDNASVLNNLGNIYYQRGNSAKAIEFYTLAAETDARDAEILINLCKANWMAGNAAEAKIHFEKAKQLEPDIARYYPSLQQQLNAP
jgi:tetratricopeptide (TPR) repeat protein